MFTNSPAGKREKPEDTPHNYSETLLLRRPYFPGGAVFSSIGWHVGVLLDSE